jgi:hypothetical protein
LTPGVALLQPAKYVASDKEKSKPKPKTKRDEEDDSEKESGVGEDDAAEVAVHTNLEGNKYIDLGKKKRATISTFKGALPTVAQHPSCST